MCEDIPAATTRSRRVRVCTPTASCRWSMGTNWWIPVIGAARSSLHPGHHRLGGASVGTVPDRVDEPGPPKEEAPGLRMEGPPRRQVPGGDGERAVPR